MDISQLNESQRNLLSQFQSISSIEDGDLCLSILVACDWNLQSSLQQVGVMDEDFNSSGGLHHRGANAGDTPLNGGSSSMIEDDDDDGDDHNAGDTSPLLGGDSGTRNRNIRNTNNNSNFRQNNGNNINNNNNSNGNSSSGGILSFLNWMITIESVPMNADRDARKFHATFRSKYGLNNIEFFDGSYRRAVAAAFRSSKMLLVYLHSSLHDDAEKYVNDILGNESLKELVGSNMVAWVGQVHDVEAYNLSNQLSITTYPSLSLLICNSDNVVQPFDKLEGYMEVNTIIERLRLAIGVQSASMMRHRQEQTQRQADSMLREQQDREYQESIEAARQARETAQKQAEEAQKAAEEEERKLQLELEKVMNDKLVKDQKIQIIRSRLTVEPAKGAEGVANLRFQLPSGSKIMRRFHKDQTVQAILDFLSIHFEDNNIEIVNFAVSTSFPKIDLDDETQTLDAVGVYPSAALMVRDLDA